MANGILVIDKPAGWTSQDVAAKLRGVFHERRVGHGGTLDPMATGVLPIFIGRATRAAEFAESAEKEYIAGLRLGLVTNTQDTTGEALEEHPVSVTREEVQTALQRFLGPIEQIPPMYSALKQNGKKLYELARAGKEVERAPRPVTIHALEVLERGAELSLCRHLETGRVLEVLTEYLYVDRGVTRCEDSTDYRLAVRPGDTLSVVRRISDRALVKKDGVTGWYFGRLAH